MLESYFWNGIKMEDVRTYSTEMNLQQHFFEIL